MGFSLVAEHRLWSTQASAVVIHVLINFGSLALEHWLSSCGTQTQLFCSMWDLPGPGIEPLSPALAGAFFTTQPPGKP